MSQSARNIIIAGEQENVLKPFIILLRRLGYRVRSASSGEEVVVSLKKKRADLVILDGQLSARDGIATLKAIKSNAAWANIPVVTLSANHSRTAQDEYIRFGYSGCLSGTLDPIAVSLLIESCLVTEEGQCRRSPRIPFVNRVNVLQEGSSCADYWAVNLSVGGIYLRTQTPFPVGTEVLVTIDLGHEGRHEARGVVIYQKGSYSDVFKIEPGMAVQFRSLEDGTEDALRRYITDQLAGDLVESDPDSNRDRSTYLN